MATTFCKSVSFVLRSEFSTTSASLPSCTESLEAVPLKSAFGVGASGVRALTGVTALMVLLTKPFVSSSSFRLVSKSLTGRPLASFEGLIVV